MAHYQNNKRLKPLVRPFFVHAPRLLQGLARIGLALALASGLVLAWDAPGSAVAQADVRLISRADYAGRLRAMWLGETIANWTGLTTEGVRTDAPFYTDADWGIDQNVAWKTNDVIDFVLQDPWLADDDTDIEYVYLTLLDRYATNLLTPTQIADGWREHINEFIWVSNLRARGLMAQGVLPPMTGNVAANADSLQIDAQLTTEIFGALAPGMPDQALRLANLPILTTAAGYAAHAAQFYVLLYALAAQADRTLPVPDQIVWMVETARAYLPDSSKSADVIDFVLADYRDNPDVNDWERTRDRVYERYQLDANDSGFVFRGWTESSVNLAGGLIALLYGQGDFRRTVQIGALAGWDSDNGTATVGGLLGLLLGYETLAAQFPDAALSDRYQSSRTRDNLPDYLPDDTEAEDTFSLMAERMLPIAERTIIEAGGRVEGDRWRLPPVVEGDPLALNPLAELTRRSANNRVLAEGGTIEVTVEGESSRGKTRAIADGAELNFSGVEPQRPPRTYAGQAQDGVLVASVVYDRPVEARTIRVIEGDPGGFAALSLEFLIDGAWTAAPEGLQPSATPDPAIPYQMFDFELAESLSISGVRLTGQVHSGPFGDIGLAEIDVLSE